MKLDEENQQDDLRPEPYATKLYRQAVAGRSDGNKGGLLVSMDDTHEEIVKRLHIVQGHVAGLARMVERGEGCTTVLHQLAAIRSAVYKITELVLVIYADDCLKVSQKREDTGSSAQELVKLLCQFLK